MSAVLAGSRDHVNVALRVRPLLPEEAMRQEEECVVVATRADTQTVPFSTRCNAKGGAGDATEVRVFTPSAQHRRRGKLPRHAGGVTPPNNTHQVQAFVFDATVGPAATQEDVWSELRLAEYCEDALDGRAATVLCFGQTGSGKTYTMSGATVESAVGAGSSPAVEEDGIHRPLVAEDGLQYRAIRFMAERLRQLNAPPPPSPSPVVDRSPKAPKAATASTTRRKKGAPTGDGTTRGSPPTPGNNNGSDGGVVEGVAATTPQPDTVHVTVKVSYLELYNEQLHDLLQGRGGLKCRWCAAAQVFYVEGLAMVECLSAEDFLFALREGQANRHRAAHRLNADSSRSHVLFTMHVETRRGEDEPTRYGKLTFVDLAGSEKLKDTVSSGADTKSINASLFALGNVIEKLSELTQSRHDTTNHRNGATPTNTKASEVFIPYRSSLLTQILMDSLSGRSRTLMIACVSPSDRFVEESLRTIHYAQRMRHVAVAPPQRVDWAAQEKRTLLQLVTKLQAENALMRTALGLAAEEPVTPASLQGASQRTLPPPRPIPPLAPLTTIPINSTVSLERAASRSRLRPSTTEVTVGASDSPPQGRGNRSTSLPPLPAALAGSRGLHATQSEQAFSSPIGVARTYGFVATGSSRASVPGMAPAKSPTAQPPPASPTVWDLLNSLPDTEETLGVR